MCPKKLTAFVIAVLLFQFSYSQIYKIKADTLLVTKDSCNAEFNLENGTRHVNGFLYNKGNGRTEFRKGLIKIDDNTYIIGSDTLKLNGNDGASDDFIKNQYAVKQKASAWIDSFKAVNINSDSIRVNSSIYLKNRWIDEFKNDTSAMTSTGVLMTADAIRQFVQGRINAIPPPNWNTVVNKPSEFTPAAGSANYIQNQNLVLQSANFHIGGQGGYGYNPATHYGGTRIRPNYVDIWTAGAGSGGVNIRGDGSADWYGASLRLEWNSTTNIGSLIGVSDIQNSWSSSMAFKSQYRNSNMLTLQGQWGGVTLENIAGEGAGYNGTMWYNTTTNTFRGFRAGAFKNFLMDGDVNLATGNIIYVDKNSINATDTRTGISKYNLFYPFVTIQAAVNAAAQGDFVSVRPGTYSENISYSGSVLGNKDVLLTLENVTLNGSIYFSSTNPLNQKIRIWGIGSTTINYTDNNSGTGAIAMNGCTYLLNNIAINTTGGGGAIREHRNTGSWSYGGVIDNVTVTGNSDTIIIGNMNNNSIIKNSSFTSTKIKSIGIIDITNYSNSYIKTVGTAIQATNSANVTLENCNIVSDSSYGFNVANWTSVVKVVNTRIMSYREAIRSFGSTGSGINVLVQNNHFVVSDSATTNALDIRGGLASSTAYVTGNVSNKSFNIATTTGLVKVVSDNIIMGNVRYSPLATSGTAPPTTGITKMVTTDANGQLSFANIPSGGSSANQLEIVNDTNYTVAEGVTHIIMDNMTASRTITLPNAATNEGRVLTIRHSGTGAGFGYVIILSQQIKVSNSATTNQIGADSGVEIFAKNGQWWITKHS